MAVSNVFRQSSGSFRVIVFVVVLIGVGALTLQTLIPAKTVLGATADVTEPESGFVLKARVDTGASVSSLHCEGIVVDGAADEPQADSGKRVRFLIQGPQGQQHWLEATVLGFAGVRSAAGMSRRYRVRMNLTCAGVTKQTIVSLSDRSEMKYPLLLGRDFLEDDFIVDVSRDNPDYP